MSSLISLIESFPGQETIELLPETETTFFVKGEAKTGDSSKRTFVKDESGKVTHILYHDFGGTDRILKKIK